jgi:hypothetical protein
MKIGDSVQKNHVNDGSINSGKPYGKILTITDIKDHEPIDGQREKDCLVFLSDGSFEFIWNLTKI